MTDPNRTDAEFFEGGYITAPAPEGSMPVWLTQEYCLPKKVVERFSQVIEEIKNAPSPFPCLHRRST